MDRPLLQRLALLGRTNVDAGHPGLVARHVIEDRLNDVRLGERVVFAQFETSRGSVLGDPGGAPSNAKLVASTREPAAAFDRGAPRSGEARPNVRGLAS